MKIYNKTKLFGDYLEEQLKLKDINKKNFASLLGINRSQLYRFLNNEQLPDEEIMEKMGNTLNLHASEKRDMMAFYESTFYGWAVVEGQVIITDILDEIENNKKLRDERIIYTEKYDDIFKIKNEVETSVISGKNNILDMFFSMIESAIKLERSVDVKLLFNPEFKAFMDLFPLLLKRISETENKVSITHIIRFKEIISEESKLFNLEILKQLIPLSKYEKIYKIFYTIENKNTNAYANLYPNFIALDKNNALLISSDFENALYFGNKASVVIEQSLEEYMKVLEDSLPLFINFNHPIKQFEYLKNYEVPLDKNLLHPEQGFYTFPIELVTKKADAYDKTGQAGKILKERMEIFRENLTKGKFTEIMPLQSLEEFVDTGDLFIQKDLNYNKEERILILKELLKFLEKEDNYRLFLIKEKNRLYNLSSAVYTIGVDILLIVPSHTNYRVTDNIIIRERSIVESFKDFFDSYFKEKNTIVDQGQVIEIIKEQIKKLRVL